MATIRNQGSSQANSKKDKPNEILKKYLSQQPLFFHVGASGNNILMGPKERIHVFQTVTRRV